MSMESLNDEGEWHRLNSWCVGIGAVLNKFSDIKQAWCLLLGEGYFTSLLEEMEYEGREFEADSWSMAVDSAYLQTHRKDVIKRQDVIYG